VEGLNAALTALGNLEVGTADRSEFWPPENENLCQLLLARRSLERSAAGGQNGRPPESVKHIQSCGDATSLRIRRIRKSQQAIHFGTKCFKVHGIPQFAQQLVRDDRDTPGKVTGS
jgi:hypothetical protein